MADHGTICILTNSAAPGVVKIGRTNRQVQKRIAEHNAQSSTIGEWKLTAQFLVPIAALEAAEAAALGELKRWKV